MLRRFLNWIDYMKLKRFQKKINKEHDVLQDIRSLMDVGFSQSQALAIINIIVGIKNI